MGKSLVRFVIPPAVLTSSNTSPICRTITMDVAPSLLKEGKKRVGQWLQTGTFFFKETHNLFAGRAVDTLVGHLTFPVLEKEVFLSQGFESPTLQCVGSYISDPTFNFAFVLRLS
jgi:hypothetical protein